jgi:hypothetical protein
MNGGLMNGGKDDLEFNKVTVSSKTHAQLSLFSLLAAAASSLGLIMVTALVIVYANTNYDCNAEVCATKKWRALRTHTACRDGVETPHAPDDWS